MCAQLNPNFLSNSDQPEQLPEKTALAAEIAERLVELEENHNGAGAELIFKLSQLYSISPEGFRLALEVMHGNTSGATNSFEQLAQKTGVLKQTMWYRWNNTIKAIRAAFPELAALLEDIRESGLNHGSGPQSAQEFRVAVHL